MAVERRVSRLGVHGQNPRFQPWRKLVILRGLSSFGLTAQNEMIVDKVNACAQQPGREQGGNRVFQEVTIGTWEA